MNPPTHDQTAQIARRAIGGSSEDLGKLVERVGGCLHAQAKRRIDRWGAGSLSPDDAVQETWVVVCTRWDEMVEIFAGDEGQRLTRRLMKYLSTTLSNVLLNHRRGMIRRRFMDARGEGSGAGPATGQPDRLQALPEETRGILTRIGQHESAARVSEAIEELNERDREIFILRGIECVSVASAAEILGMQPSAVSTAYNRCLGKLRKRVPNSVFADFVEDEEDP